jgi:hypothetical protein
MKPRQLKLYCRCSTTLVKKINPEIKTFCLGPFVNGRLHKDDIDLLHRHFGHCVANDISDNILKTAFKLVQ